MMLSTIVPSSTLGIAVDLLEQTRAQLMAGGGSSEASGPGSLSPTNRLTDSVEHVLHPRGSGCRTTARSVSVASPTTRRDADLGQDGRMRTGSVHPCAQGTSPGRVFRIQSKSANVGWFIASPPPSSGLGPMLLYRKPLGLIQSIPSGARPPSKAMVAARPGFEPGTEDPKSFVLPLHHRAAVEASIRGRIVSGRFAGGAQWARLTRW